MVLAALNRPLSHLPALSSKIARILGDWGFAQISQLLLHLPRSYRDRRTSRPLVQWQEGEVHTTVKVVNHHYFPLGRGRALKVEISDESRSASLICYGRNNLAYLLRVGEHYRLAGRFQLHYRELQSSLFEFEPAEDPPLLFNRIVPLYTLPKGLQQRHFLQIIEQALLLLKESEELSVAASPALENWPAVILQRAFTEAHLPTEPAAVKMARRNLAFLELLQLETTIIWIRTSSERRQSISATVPQTNSSESTIPTATSPLMARAIANLPFTLTRGQQLALTEIHSKLQQPRAMQWLLQGDVGAGKTLVALLAAIGAIERGWQVACMVPTELLAQQHWFTCRPLCEALQISCGLLTASLSAAERQRILKELAAGTLSLIIGTQALFSDEVLFHNLRLIIIDEQQRFGVKQRVALLHKAQQPHLLMMTATPIPRTLALTQFSGFGLSEIRSLPADRQPVETHLAKQSNEQKVFSWVARELQKGHQAYVVSPIIEPSERLSLRDAIAMQRLLAEHYLSQWDIGLIHSQMEEQEKEWTMQRFVDNRLPVLVATSVVEVGINVLNATCMVIDHAERFGLSSLHQLRGRVGRGALQSYAFLIYDDQAALNPLAGERLKLLLHEHNGFHIAEADLLLRGAGDLTGTRQSGFRRTQIAHLPQHLPLLTPARAAAETILAQDPALQHPEHRWLRHNLQGNSS